MSHLAALKREGRRLQGNDRGKALLVISAGSFLMIGVQMIYPVLLPELRASYGFDLTTAGMLLTLLWIANAAGQLPGGMLADLIGERMTLLASVLIAATTLVLIVAIDSVLALFAATLLFGVGLALYGVARYTAVYDLHPDRAGTSVGIVLAAADAGQALLPPIASAIAVAFVWQFGFGAMLPLFALVAVGLWMYVPAQTGDQTKNNTILSITRSRALLSEMYTRSVGYGTAVLITYMTVWVAFTSFYPSYLIEVKGLSSTRAALLFGSFFAVGVVIKPLSGAAYDRLGIRRSLLAIASLPGVSLVVLPAIQGIVPLTIVTVLIAPMLGSIAVAQSYLLDALADDSRGTGLGAIRTGGLTIAAMAPVFFGAIADRGFFDEVFLLIAGLVGLMIVFVALIPSDR